MAKRWLVVSMVGCLCVFAPASLSAQTTEQDIRKLNEALLVAAAKADKAAYAQLAADDLRWVGADGLVLTKAERISRLVAPSNSGRTFRDMDIKVYGDLAVMVGRSDWKDNGKPLSERVLRVYTKRNGRWLLLNHAATPLPADAK